jgi:hypothetical protein
MRGCWYRFLHFLFWKILSMILSLSSQPIKLQTAWISTRLSCGHEQKSKNANNVILVHFFVVIECSQDRHARRARFTVPFYQVPMFTFIDSILRLTPIDVGSILASHHKLQYTNNPLSVTNHFQSMFKACDLWALIILTGFVREDKGKRGSPPSGSSIVLLCCEYIHKRPRIPWRSTPRW